MEMDMTTTLGGSQRRWYCTYKSVANMFARTQGNLKIIFFKLFNNGWQLVCSTAPAVVWWSTQEGAAIRWVKAESEWQRHFPVLEPFVQNHHTLFIVMHKWDARFLIELCVNINPKLFMCFPRVPGADSGPSTASSSPKMFRHANRSTSPPGLDK